MPVDYLAVVKLYPRSGIPQDAVDHSWAFTHSTGGLTGRAAIVTALMNFYNNVPTGGTAAPGSYISDVISRTVAPDVTFYDVSAHLAGDPHGSPEAVVQFGAFLPAPSGANFPSELAACLSFHSSYGSDVEFGSHTRPRAQDRGRIFFGPLQANVQDNDIATRRPRLAAAFRDNMVKAAGDLRALADPKWCVWSRVDAAFKPVTAGWVDDAFDVQRRRGEKALLRSTF